MPQVGNWGVVESSKDYYWGLKAGRIDIEKDDQGNWSWNGVRFTAFDASRVPILLLRYVPYCPECKEPCMEGFLNFEEDDQRNMGIAYRHFHHFWYQGAQMWSYPPREREQLPPNTANVTFQASSEDSYAYERGKSNFTEGVKSYNNPYDGRTSAGKAWYRGWKEAESAGKAQD